MISEIQQPDISTLVTRGHFYFGWTAVYITVVVSADLCFSVTPK